MKALVAEPPKRNSSKLIDISKPVPPKGHVLLKPWSVGIDGTDREINEGLYGTPPDGYNYLVLGHETVASVEEINGEEPELSVGDVVVPTVRRPCTENCLNCRNGETDMCLTGNYFEHGIYKLHGFASEYATSEANFLVKIPEELNDIAVLLEPLSIAEKALSQAFTIQRRMVWAPKTAFVLGAGPLGLLATIILRLRGLDVYTGATRTKESLKAKLVFSVGGNYINVRETPIQTLDKNFDLVIEATGRVEVALQAFKLLRPNSVMCFLGVYPEKRACRDFGKILTKMVLENRLMFGSVNANKGYFKRGIKTMFEASRRYGTILNKLITKKLPLSDFAQALKPEREDIKTIIYLNS